MWEALGDRTRREIVLRLSEGPRPVGELATYLPVSRSAVSQHLKVLKDAGLVAERAAGTRRIYRLNEVGVVALRDQLDTFWNRALSGFQELVTATTGGQTMSLANEAVVRHQIVVDTSIDRAFAAFVERFGDFKPPEHNLLGAEITENGFQPRWVATSTTAAADGSECRWARVLVYEPPDRVVFSWDISPRWQLEADESNASEVEVRFVAETPERTRSSSSTATSNATDRAGSRSRRYRW